MPRPCARGRNHLLGVVHRSLAARAEGRTGGDGIRQSGRSGGGGGGEIPVLGAEGR